MIFYHTLTILYIYCLGVQLFIEAGLFILRNTSIYLTLIIIFKFDFYLIFLLKSIILPKVNLSIIFISFLYKYKDTSNSGDLSINYPFS